MVFLNEPQFGTVPLLPLLWLQSFLLLPLAPCNNHVLLTESLVTGPDYTAALFLSKDAVARRLYLLHIMPPKKAAKSPSKPAGVAKVPAASSPASSGNADTSVKGSMSFVHCVS